MRRVLAIGGSDSGGGAGIQADLRTLHTLGLHGSTVVTAVTAQDTVGVHGIWDVPVEGVRAQLAAVLNDIGADAVKTGMLLTPASVVAVAEAVRGIPLVVDPVGVSSTGHSLLTPEALEVLRTVLLPLATVVTPNLDEVRALTGVEVRSEADLLDAAKAVHALGPRWVCITGGHLDGDPVDLLYDGTTPYELRGERVATPHTHGSGCTFATALAAFLAMGEPTQVAARRAKSVVTAALQQSYPIGRGAGPVRPS
jgi:hydroxymethylpyrimidine/phosphomethylpyrimidine kinase